MRTYERGVEGETLACGTGSVAAAILLSAKGEAESSVALTTRSGKVLRVRLRREGDRWIPALSGKPGSSFKALSASHNPRFSLANTTVIAPVAPKVDVRACQEP